jgi:hypothetical protein
MRKTKSQKIEKQLEEIKELLKEISQKLDRIGKTEIHYYFDNKSKEWKPKIDWHPSYSTPSTTSNPEWYKLYWC